MTVSANTTLAQFIEQIAERPAKTCRRFGLEIETPEAGSITADGFTKTHDPSVSDGECKCECDSCSHSCDCGNCSITNGYEDNEHCGDCTSNELALDYYQGTDSTGNGLIRQTCEELQNAGSDHYDHYRGHPYGGHIHTEARDLTPLQVALLMRYYRHAQNLFDQDQFFGRETNDYCSDITDRDIDQTVNGWEIDRMSAINTQNYFSFRYAVERGQRSPDQRAKSTLEFRQFASTNNWQLTLARIAFCVALVDYTAQGFAPYWLLRTKTWQEFASVIEM